MRNLFSSLSRGWILLFFVLTQTVLPAQDTLQHIESGRKNAASTLAKPYLILISADGFRYDYADKYQAPNLLRLRGKGVQAKSMIPSFPSLTFPNHYSIATGLYPAHHGLVDNSFYDRQKKDVYSMSSRNKVEDGSWYHGKPLWVLAEQQQVISASYYFVGSEANIENTRPTYWYRFKDSVDIDERIDKLISWLQLPEDVRPHLITFYISDVDHAGHDYGPDAPETEKAVLFVDSAIGKMTARIEALGLPVNFIFLSDHGMTKIDTSKRINVTRLIDASLFVMRGGGTTSHLYAKSSKDILPTYKLLKAKADGYKVYLRERIPSRWHYDKAEDRYNRIGDIFLVPRHPHIFSTRTTMIDPGYHGFDPSFTQMHATFYAWGPQFQEHKIISSFENVHIYPMVCKLLGLTYTHQIDGRLKVLEKILK